MLDGDSFDSSLVDFRDYIQSMSIYDGGNIFRFGFVNVLALQPGDFHISPSLSRLWKKSSLIFIQ